ncbi:hypothetical protein CTheo_8553 [Ceratobasidium theobromae]|uniref:Uncharacterized protein n=1 Tax=Ceratobasidium theobromae TaxID=1582974 RepID=A0A5N5Q8G3_9AGAM|nr:hypothetical protein CTheo_8553 [Ceratobasidium theobromae]
MAGPQRDVRACQHNHIPYRRPNRSPTPEEAPSEQDVHDTHVLDSDRSPLPTDARQLTQMVSMFWSARVVLNTGKEICQAREDDSEQAIRDAASQAHKLNFALYDELDRLQPDLFDLLATEGNHFIRNVRDKLNKGRSGAKAEDNHKVKHAIPHLKRWEPSLVDEPKDKHGLIHPEWRKGIGAKYQLTQVTPAFLAYIAVLVRFTLSSEDTFSDDGGTFNYIDFYSQLRNFLERPQFNRCTKVLLEWWNNQLFPDAIRDDTGGTGAGNPPDGMLVLLEAEFDEDEAELVDADEGED